jgi:hypothetical protein
MLIAHLYVCSILELIVIKIKLSDRQMQFRHEKIGKTPKIQEYEAAVNE